MYRLFFENNLDALLLSNDAGDIFAANKAACVLFQRSEQELIQGGRQSVVDKEDQRLASILSSRARNSKVKARLRLLRGDQSAFEAEITTTIVEYENEKRTLILVRDISREVENERRLLENQRHNEILISNLPGMVFQSGFDNNYPFSFVSSGCLRLTGYKSSDFLKGKISYAELVLPKYRDLLWDECQRMVLEGSNFEGEYQIRDRQGKIKWVWERSRPVYNEQGELLYLEGYIEDISRRKSTEIESIKFSRAVEQNMTSIVLTDIHGNIEYANQSAVDLSCYSLNELIGKNMRMLKSGFVPDEVYSNMWVTITAGKTWKGELINKNKKGGLYWVNKSISPIIDPDGNITNFVSVAENITQRKKDEEELIEAKKRAEEVDQLKTAFLANMSHELRTPLNAVIGFSELINEELPKEQILEFSRIINQSGNNLLDIVEQIFDVSLLETGDMAVDSSVFDLVPLFDGLETEIVRMQQKHRKQDLHISAMLPAGMKSYMLNSDEKCLRQIMRNLLDNAVKFTTQGTVQFGFEIEGEQLLFWVSDSGPGISPTKQKMIFTMFSQVEQSYTRSTGGTGIGLTISQKLVELLRGKMWVESCEGQGSTFYFTIPCTFQSAASI